MLRLVKQISGTERIVALSTGSDFISLVRMEWQVLQYDPGELNWKSGEYGKPKHYWYRWPWDDLRVLQLVMAIQGYLDEHGPDWLHACEVVER